MLIGAVVGFATAVSTGNPWLGRGGGDARGRAAEPAPRHDHDHVPGRPGRVGAGPDVPRHGTGPGPGRGAQQRRLDRAGPPVLDPAARRHPGPRPRRVHGAERPRLPRVPARARDLVLDQPHPARPQPARGRRGARGRRRARRQRVRDPLPLRVHRRAAGGPRGRDDHARGPAGLVRGAHGERPGLDRGGARDLRPVVAVPGRGRRLPVRGGGPADPRHAAAAHDHRPAPTRSSSTTPNTFFLEMLPYALVLLALVLGSRNAMRRRIGAPAALGVPYVRGERGR